jgi:hypothetical protein
MLLLLYLRDLVKHIQIEVKLIPLCSGIKILLYIEYKSTGHYNHGRDPQSLS